MNKKVLYLVHGAVIAALYVVLTLLANALGLANYAIQVRFSEALTILPVFTPAAIPGLFIGCLIGNILGGAILPDIIFGSIATLIGAFFTWKLREKSPMKSWQYFIITDGNCNNFNLSLSLSRNSVDNPIFPRRGSDFQLSVAATPPYSLWDGKDYKNLARDYRAASYNKEMQEKYRWVEYHKWKFKLRTYTALTGKNKCPVLMTRTDFGFLGHYNKYKKSPFETFYMGGDGMSGYSSGYATETIGLRGYENGCLTPYGAEGYAYSRMTVELRYPLMLKGQTNIYALAFAEGGNAWYDTKKFNPFDMKRSAGAGVRLFLPMVGLMGIDWAYGFDKVFGSSKNGGSHIHFIIGQEF